MQYKKLGRTDYNVSILGFGCMRLPVVQDAETVKNFFERQMAVDEEKAIEMIDYAINQGINYFDSAYMYHGGKSEVILGKALQNRREKVIVTTKSPLRNIETSDDFDRILDEQLGRLGTDFLDFYLLHGIGRESWSKAKELDALGFLDKIQKDGRAKYVGFSFHDDVNIFKEIIDSYEWTICQIQYNYFDENYQAGKEGLQYAASKGIGVVIMEPLRGGKLTNKIPEDVQRIWNSTKRGWTPAEWGLRWVWNHPEVSLLLSGMSSMAQLEENIRIAEDARPESLSSEEMDTIHRVADTYRRLLRVDCTGCAYCMPCPNGVNIPMNFTLYNDYYLFQDLDLSQAFYNDMMPPEHRASSCAECGECEEQCPQHIEIIEELKKVDATLRRGDGPTHEDNRDGEETP
jgi:predicted aldo/keto reductase-like oxidoreductase